jgi:hypothetical protein
MVNAQKSKNKTAKKPQNTKKGKPPQTEKCRMTCVLGQATL